MVRQYVCVYVWKHLLVECFSMCCVFEMLKRRVYKADVNVVLQIKWVVVVLFVLLSGVLKTKSEEKQMKVLIYHLMTTNVD